MIIPDEIIKEFMDIKTALVKVESPRKLKLSGSIQCIAPDGWRVGDINFNIWIDKKDPTNRRVTYDEQKSRLLAQAYGYNKKIEKAAQKISEGL